MCDFAADAAAAEQLMVGRTLSLVRVTRAQCQGLFLSDVKRQPGDVENLSGDRE
jgi:hypothetical protein